MISRFRQLVERKQAAAVVGDWGRYRGLMARAATGQVTDREVETLMELSGRLDRDLAKDVDAFAKSAELEQTAAGRDKLAAEMAKARKAADDFDLETRDIADKRAGQSARLRGLAVQAAAAHDRAVEASRQLNRLKRDNRDLFDVQKTPCHLLPLNERRDLMDKYDGWIRTMRYRIGDTAVGSAADELRASIARLEAERDRELERLDKQRVAIERGNVRAAEVGEANIAGIAADLCRDHEFVIAPLQDATEFNKLKALVESRGRTYRNYGEALAAV